MVATDLRAGAALVLAGLAAEGCSTIHGLHYIDRGYEAIDEKLRSVGAKVYRCNNPAGIPATPQPEQADGKGIPLQNWPT